MFGKITDFIREIFSSLDSGYLFFGGPLDLVRYIIDIILVTFIIYSILRIIRDTRAWQLLKGVLLILVFILFCSFLGLEMVGYIFNKLLYIVAILFVVLFQPELRHALETVGLKSFSSFSSAIISDDSDDQFRYANMVDEIVKACTEMARTYTGAIMLIERTTKLGELLKQENVVRLDSSVTSSMLQSIFYKGSPMHDGALLIRDGRIIAARCHVPLAETFHMIEKYGTRHRAAVGASEIGDTVAVVVSEERGSMSIAVAGVLYEMKDGKELRKNLSYLLGLTTANNTGKLSAIRGMKHLVKNNKKDAKVVSEEVVDQDIVVAKKAEEIASAKKSESESLPVVAKKKKIQKKGSRSRNAVLMLVSFALSLLLWMYIQITTNPVTEKTYSLQLQYENMEILNENGMGTDFPVENVSVRIVGRKSVIDKLTSSDLSAYIDLSEVESTGSVRLKVHFACDDNVYFRVEMQRPEDVAISVYTLE